MFCAANLVFIARTNDVSKAGGVCVKDNTPSTEETSWITRLFKYVYVEENYVSDVMENFDGETDQREKILSVTIAKKTRYS